MTLCSRIQFPALCATLVSGTMLSQSASSLPTVYTDQSAFLAATTPDQTSDFETLPFGGLGNPFSHEGVNYLTLHSSGVKHGTMQRSSSQSVSGGISLGNNSTPNMTLTFDRGAASAIGFYVIPSFSSAGVWEMTLSLSDGSTFVDNFSHDTSRSAQYRGYIEPAGIDSIRISRPAGQLSPNHTIDDLSITFVPEPTSLVLLGLSGLLVGRRRRS